MLKNYLYKLRGELKLKLNRNISSKIFLGPNVQIFGIENVLIKENCTIGENTLITINHRIKKKIQLIINDNVYLGRDFFISVGKSIYIGNYCVFGENCSLISAGKIFDNPLVPYALSGNSNDKKIEVGVNCWFGNDASVIGDVKIGHGSIIGANTVVTKDIPPFSMVVGNPAKIIKTFNFENNQWVRGEYNNDSIYMDENVYLNYLKTNSGDVPLAYHSASSRLGHL